MDQLGQITTVIKNHIKGFSARESGKSLFNAPNVLLFSLALPSENRNTCGSNTKKKLSELLPMRRRRI
jgi:hypothetical protein